MRTGMFEISTLPLNDDSTFVWQVTLIINATPQFNMVFLIVLLLPLNLGTALSAQLSVISTPMYAALFQPGVNIRQNRQKTSDLQWMIY